jgi:hypothetical protein
LQIQNPVIGTYISWELPGDSKTGDVSRKEGIAMERRQRKRRKLLKMSLGAGGDSFGDNRRRSAKWMDRSSRLTLLGRGAAEVGGDDVGGGAHFVFERRHSSAEDPNISISCVKR